MISLFFKGRPLANYFEIIDFAFYAKIVFIFCIFTKLLGLLGDLEGDPFFVFLEDIVDLLLYFLLLLRVCHEGVH